MKTDGAGFRPPDNIRLAKLGWPELSRSILETLKEKGYLCPGSSMVFRACFTPGRAGLEKDQDCTWITNTKSKPFFSVPVLVHRKERHGNAGDRIQYADVYIGNHERESELTLDVLTEQYAQRKGVNLNDDPYGYRRDGFTDGGAERMGHLPCEKPEGMTLFLLNRARFFQDNSFFRGKDVSLGNPVIGVGNWWDDRYNSEEEIMRSFRSRDFFSIDGQQNGKLTDHEIQCTRWMTYHARCAVYRQKYMQNMFADRLCRASCPAERRLRYIKCFDMIPSFSDAMYLVPEEGWMEKMKNEYPPFYKGPAGKPEISFHWKFRDKNSLPFINALGYTLFRPVDGEICVHHPANNVLLMDDYEPDPALWSHFTTMVKDGKVWHLRESEELDCIALEKILGPEKFGNLLERGLEHPLYIQSMFSGVTVREECRGIPTAVKVETELLNEGTLIKLSHHTIDGEHDTVFEKVFYRKNPDGSHTRMTEGGIRVRAESRKLLFSYLSDLSSRLAHDAREYGKSDLLGLFAGRDFTCVEGISDEFPFYVETAEEKTSSDKKRKLMWKNLVYVPGGSRKKD